MQNQILTMRSSKIFDYLFGKKQIIYQNFQNFEMKIGSIEEFLSYLENTIPFKQLKKEFQKINRNQIPDLKNYP